MPIPTPTPRKKPISTTSSTPTPSTLRKPTASSSSQSSTLRSGVGNQGSTLRAGASRPPTLRSPTSSSSLSAGQSSASAPTARSPVKRTVNSSASTLKPQPPRSPTKSPAKPAHQELWPDPPKTPGLSLREQIALKRAEAQKAQATRRRSPNLGDEPADDDWNGGRGKLTGEEEEDILGRKSVKETIERARESGNLNLSARDLNQLPSSLFIIHLGIEPQPLPLPEISSGRNSSAEDSKPSKHLAYYEVVDLTVLKARDNSISLLQPEISLFGGIKTLDFAKNKLSKFPDSFGELTCLIHLDLSQNAFEEFPHVICYLPTLALLDLSGNSLHTLKLPSEAASSSDFGTSSFFSQPARNTTAGPLPALKTLNLAKNKLTASAIETKSFPPKSLTNLDLSENPLGQAADLLKAIATHRTLRDVSLRKTELDAETLAPTDAQSFPNMTSLDLSENAWLTAQHVQTYFSPIGKKVILTSSRGPVGEQEAGALTVRVGAKDTREAWEIASDAQSKRSATNRTPTPAFEEEGLGIGDRSKPPVFAGGRRKPLGSPTKTVQKEDPTVEIEEDVFTEAGRLRKRLAEAEELAKKEEAEAELAKSVTSESSKAVLEKYYDATSRTITLPASKRATHNRHASLAFPRGGLTSGTDPNVPTETLPLSVIAAQHPWGVTLRGLHMSNRRAEAAFLVRSGLRLDTVEDVMLDGCGLSDLVRIKDGENETREPIFEALGAAFPGLAALDLSENGLTGVSGIVKLFFPSFGGGRGLKVLRLKGNSINDLEGLVEVAERFGRGESDGWRGEEIDIRDNQVPKLPPVLGLLQLDVLLVEGNAFRVPPRQIWLREGTQGLLKYLRESVV